MTKKEKEEIKFIYLFILFYIFLITENHIGSPKAELHMMFTNIFNIQNYLTNIVSYSN